MKNFEIWSNLAVVAVGIYIALTTSVSWGLGVIFMGIGSMHFHWSGNPFYDWMGMYAAYILQINHSLAEIGEHGIITKVVLFLITLIVFGGHNYFRSGRLSIEFPDDHGPVLDARFGVHFLVLGMLYTTAAILAFYAFGWIAASVSLVVYGVAFMVQAKSHWLWHIGAALGIFVLTL